MAVARRLLAASAAGLAALALAVPSALADGDPASDVLITQPAYLPYQPAVSPKVTALVTRAVRETQKTGHPIKVAVIASPVDLGAVPDFFGRPQEYARFLAGELRAFYRGGLLIVMPAGLGTANVPSAAASALRGVTVSGTSGDSLARAGVLGIQALARAEGHPIPQLVRPGGGFHADWTRAIVAVAAFLVAVALVVALGHELRRRRDRRPAGAPA